MNEPPPIPPMAPLPGNQRSIDEDHLNLLSIFYFVSAGLSLLGILALFADFVFLHFFFSNPAFMGNQKGGPPPVAVFRFFLVFFVFFGALLVLLAILNVMSGFFLRERKHRTFSLVIAAIDCMQFPLGTALGVFTFIVLTRESVRKLYETPGYR
jgi:uncharacterized membrane protein YozB (DUF420 family)